MQSPKTNSEVDLLQERLRQMMLLQEAAHKINSILDLDTLLNAIVGDVAQTFGCSRSAVLLMDEAANELELVAVKGWTDDIHPKGFRFKIGIEGVRALLCVQGQPPALSFDQHIFVAVGCPCSAQYH